MANRSIASAGLAPRPYHKASMNPTCPHCQGDRKLAKNGTNTSSDTQRYRCTAKGCGYSLSDSPHTQGRPTKWDEAMTNADKQAEYRVRREEKKAIENKKEENNK